MLVRFFFFLRQAGLPVSLTEFLALLDALDRHLVLGSIEDFYRLARITLVKDESRYDLFDRAFGAFFEGVEMHFDLIAGEIPEDWLRAAAKAYLSDEEKAKIDALGGFDKLMETLAERLREQQERHEGGSKWIGTGGTSPFGHSGSVRCCVIFAPGITGASCRSSTPPTWCFASRRPSSPCMRRSCAPPKRASAPSC